MAEDRIQLGGVSTSSLNVQTNGTATLIDLNGNTVITLNGITVPANAIQFS